MNATNVMPDFLRNIQLQECPYDIAADTQIKLKDKKILGKVESSSQIRATQCWVQSMSAVGEINLSKVYCEGCISSGDSVNAKEVHAQSIEAGADIELEQSTIPKTIRAGGAVLVDNCPKLGPVHASSLAKFAKCESVESIEAGGPITLRDTHIVKSATTSGAADIVRSTIPETLTCTSDNLVIKASEIGTIDLRIPKYPSQPMNLSGAGIHIGSTIMGSCGNNSGNINMGNSAGSLVFGPGTRIGSTIIGSAGSNSGNINIGNRTTKGVSALPNNVKDPVIELHDSTVKKDIIFEKKNGKVYLHGNSSVGNVTGGVIIKV